MQKSSQEDCSNGHHLNLAELSGRASWADCLKWPMNIPDGYYANSVIIPWSSEKGVTAIF